MEQKYNKGYKYRLLPKREQRIMLGKTFGCVRFMWNKMLAHTQDYYKEHGKTDYLTPASFKEEFTWLREVDSLSLANTQVNLKKAFTGFFEKRTEYPRFKSKKATKQSYTTNNQEASNAIRIEGNYIRLPKLGWVKFVQHRKLNKGEKIKNCTITKTPAGNYTISIIVEGLRDIQPVKVSKEKVIGLDYSMKDLYVSSNGETANHQHCYRKSEKKLAKLGKEVSRKVQGSKNRDKARVKLAREYEHTANLRTDCLHKMSFRLANEYDAIIIEDLNMQGMSQALRFGKSVMDNAWGKFTHMLDYKLEERGKQLIRIDKWHPSSKLCSACGIRKENLSLSERIYSCEHCGNTQDRDLNAAINIRTAGIAGIAW